jgi:hypothetical protein
MHSVLMQYALRAHAFFTVDCCEEKEVNKSSVVVHLSSSSSSTQNEHMRKTDNPMHHMIYLASHQIQFNLTQPTTRCRTTSLPVARLVIVGEGGIMSSSQRRQQH